MTNSPKKIYGLLGYPLGHSFSRNFFNQKFETEQINAQYINFEIPDINLLMEIVAENENLNGLNITIPYKQQVLPYLDDLDEAAKEIGAVNVIKFIRTNNSLSLKGYNSDVIGFTDSIKPKLKPCHTAALVLGTGGASKAVKYALEKLGLEVQYVSRNKNENTITYEELSQSDLKKYKVIVNTTPLGMFPKIDTCPEIPYNYLTTDHLCYDLVYNPEETLFLKNAKEYGADTKNGLEMLILQALAAYNIWNS